MDRIKLVLYALVDALLLDNGPADPPILSAAFYLVWSGIALVLFRSVSAAQTTLRRIIGQVIALAAIMLIYAFYVTGLLPFLNHIRRCLDANRHALPDVTKAAASVRSRELLNLPTVRGRQAAHRRRDYSAGRWAASTLSRASRFDAIPGSAPQTATQR